MNSRKQSAKAQTSAVNDAGNPVDDQTTRAVESALGQNVIGDFLPSDMLGTANDLLLRAAQQPMALVKATLDFWVDLAKVLTGREKHEPEAGDRRFSDKAYADSPVYSALLQGYLAWRSALRNYADIAELNERERFLLDQLIEAGAPTNTLLGNAAALRATIDSRGKSLVNGAKNLIDDIRKGRPIPSQVDDSAFKVGENLAVSKGSIVLRTEMFELIQYAAQTETVHERPILIVPSIVNKFYIFDIAPGRSIVEYFIKNGHTVFMLAWRNPQKRHDRWGMSDYQDAIDVAIDATRVIRASPDVNMWAICGAGPVAVSMAGYYAAKKTRKINSLLLVVSPLDTKAAAQAPSLSAFAEPENETVRSMVRTVTRNKRISANEFTLLFAMLRPNDLIWNYWISNYLMGTTPAAFDVLYWNSDGTGMTAQFNHDFAKFVEENPFATDGAMKVRDMPIAPLSKLDIDSYVLGAINDHLCIWQSVYRSAQLLGERSQFVLGNSGHIQTIVSPPGNPKASFFTNEAKSETAEGWLKTAQKNPGSWWDHGVAWTAARAGAMVPAPSAEGSAELPPLCAAPGTYVYERG
jgi:polyhydroxyalkanoate synthase subunit PhaC